MSRLLPIVATVVALAGSGCGGSGAGAGDDSAAEIAPTSSAAFLELESDLGSDEWREARALLDRFPAKPRLLAELRRSLADNQLDYERDVEPALGDTVAVIFLDFENDGENVVVATQPEDEAKFEQLVAKLDEEGEEDSVTDEFEGWALVAPDRATLARFEREAKGDRLADGDTFSSVLEDLPEERLATAYVAGNELTGALRDAVQGSGQAVPGFGNAVASGRLHGVSAALEAQDDGAALVLNALGDAENAEAAGEPFEPTLAEEAPEDAFAFVSFTGKGYRGQLDRVPAEQRRLLRQLERTLGVTASELTELLDGEAALYARPGAPITEVTLVAREEDEREALATLDRLATRASARFGGRPPRPTRVEGVDAKIVGIGGLGITYAAFDGKLVVTSSSSGIAGLRTSDDHLADAEDYTSAREAAGIPDETAGFVYVNVAEALPVLTGLGGLAGQEVPSEATENLRHVRSLVSWSEADDEATRVVVFAQVE